MKWRIMVAGDDLADAATFGDEIGLPLSLRVYAEGMVLETDDKDAAIMAALAFGAAVEVSDLAGGIVVRDW